MKVRKAIIPAAGLGTRFLPATKAQPKEMLPIVDKPTLQYIIEEAVDSGIEEILIITGRNKKSIEDHFDKSVELEYELESKGKYDLLEEVRNISDMVNIHYIRQKEPKGLGHAIYCAKSFIGKEPFAVMLGDDVVDNEKKPCLRQMIDIYNEYKTTILGVQAIALTDISKYGIVDGKHIGDRVYKVEGLVEKPTIEESPSNIAILGRYVITPAIFEILEYTALAKVGKFSSQML
jgi:UTP--glucose-1-phosphate uridylyltransferase